MFLVKLWDRYDREVFFDLHKEDQPARSSLTDTMLKTLLIWSGSLKKKEKKR